jgi:hypothetical protein
MSVKYVDLRVNVLLTDVTIRRYKENASIFIDINIPEHPVVAPF